MVPLKSSFVCFAVLLVLRPIVFLFDLERRLGLVEACRTTRPVAAFSRGTSSSSSLRVSRNEAVPRNSQSPVRTSTAHFAQRPVRTRPTPSKTACRMGLFDSVSSMFLKKREGDFVKLGDGDDRFGPGPLLVLYDFPAASTIDDGEILDMIHDGAPTAHRQGCTLYRIVPQRQKNGDSSSSDGGGGDDPVLDLSLQEALTKIMATAPSSSSSSTEKLEAIDATAKKLSVAAPPPRRSGGTGTSSSSSGATVFFFSGFRNDEMMAVYDLLGKELYEEMGRGGTVPPPACAKAVPNAMSKPLRQVLEEISGDHRDAMGLDDGDGTVEQEAE